MLRGKSRLVWLAAGFTVKVTGGDNATKSFSLTVNAGPKMIRLEGYKYLIGLDNYDGTQRYRAQVQVTDAAGNVLTEKTSLKEIKVYDSPGLSQVNNPDNSITLLWTNPPGLVVPLGYYLVVTILSDDTNGDGLQYFLLYANQTVLTTSYTIPAAFVQNTLAGKTGLSWAVDVRQLTSSPVTFPDNTSSRVQIYRNRSAQVPFTL